MEKKPVDTAQAEDLKAARANLVRELDRADRAIQAAMEAADRVFQPAPFRERRRVR